MPSVGVSVAPPAPTAIVAVDVKAGSKGVPLVAVAGVVVRLGTAVAVKDSVVAVSEGSRMGGVAVSVTGATVMVGRAVNVCATEVFASASAVPAEFAVGTVLGTGLEGRHAPRISAAITGRAIFFMMPSFRAATPHGSCGATMGLQPP